MNTDGPVKILIYGFAFIAIGLIGLAAYLLMQDAKVKEDSLYGSPLSQNRLVSALKDNLENDLGTIEAYANVIIERNPRMTLPRRALVSVYAQRGELEDFERVFYPLFSVDRTNTDAYASALAKMSIDQRVFERARRKVLEEKPAWGGLYLRRLLSETEKDVSEYQELMRFYPRHKAAFVREVMTQLNIEQAYASFNVIMGPEIGTAGIDIIDSDFTREEFSWPFGWLLDRETVSREPDGGLAIVYFGRGTPVIIQQISHAQTGSYKLVILANGEASRTKGYFRLEVRCWQGQSLADLTLDNVEAVPMEYVLPFDTSAMPDCDFVHVRLIGQAGAFPAPIRLSVHSITLRLAAEREAQ